MADPADREVRRPRAARALAARSSDIDGEIAALVDDMVDTMYAAPGIGLAAPQIGVPLRVIVIDLSVGEDKSQLIQLVNPEFVEREGEQRHEEGCLSVPGYGGSPVRPARVVVKGLDLDGKERVYEGDASSWPAPSATRSTTSTACSSWTASPR